MLDAIPHNIILNLGRHRFAALSPHEPNVRGLAANLAFESVFMIWHLGGALEHGRNAKNMEKQAAIT